MILSLPFAARMTGVGTLPDGTTIEVDLTPVKQQFRRTKAQIVGGWNIDHLPNGHHGAVVATSVACDTLTVNGAAIPPASVSWTPVIGGSGGTTGQAYTRQNGTSLKIGPLVFARCDVELSTAGTITGNVQIQGLPYTSAVNVGGMSIGYFSGLATNWIAIGGTVNGSATTVTLYGRQTAGTGGAAMAAADIGNTCRFVATFMYQAAS